MTQIAATGNACAYAHQQTACAQFHVAPGGLPAQPKGAGTFGGDESAGCSVTSMKLDKCKIDYDGARCLFICNTFGASRQLFAGKMSGLALILIFFEKLSV